MLKITIPEIYLQIIIRNKLRPGLVFREYTDRWKYSANREIGCVRRATLIRGISIGGNEMLMFLSLYIECIDVEGSAGFVQVPNCLSVA